MDKISQIMERYRMSAGTGGVPLSYAELGRRIGVSRTQAENFCKGRSIPSDEAVLRISEEIGYDEMRLLVLEHHDRAPEDVKPVWREIMGRLESFRGKFPTTDPRVIGLLERYKELPNTGKSAFVKLAGLFLKLSSAFQEHLVHVVERWARSHETLEEELK
jgi:transcriptional regulator with XRE-family HTH domain